MFNLNKVEDQFQITKESLLNLIDQEAIFSDYGIPYQDFEFKNPLREEKHSSCKFYYNKNGELRLVDFTGWFKGNVFDFVMFIEKKNFKDVLFLIYERYVQGKDIPLSVYKKRQSIKKNTFNSYSNTKIDVVFGEFNKVNYKFWKDQGITINTLKTFKVKPPLRVDVNKKIVYKSDFTYKAYMYYFGEVESIHRVKIYFPGMEMKFLTNSREIEGLKQLRFKSDTLVITKSLKDVMLLFEFGIESIAPPSEGFMFSKETIDYLKSKYKKVYVLYDFDYAGVRGMQRLKKEHQIEPILLQRKRSFVSLAKDLTDHYKLLKEYNLESLKSKGLTIKQLVQKFRDLLDEKSSNSRIHRQNTNK